MANKRGSIQTKNPSSSWFNNVAKSLGYTTTDIVTKLTPSVGEFINDNSGYAKDVIRDIRELRSDSGRLNDALSNNSTVKIAKMGIKNALEDIRTGKIYNKERQAKMIEDSSTIDSSFGGDEELGLVDISMDDDDSFEIDEGSTKTKVAVPKVSVNVQAPSFGPNNPMVKAVDRQSKVTVQVAQANMNMQQSIASNQMLISQKIGTATVSGLQTMNDNLSLLVNFQNDSMAKYIGASIKYYDEHLKATRESIDELKKMVKAQTETPEQKRRETANPADDLFLSNGGLNVQAYVNNITKNVKNNPFYDQIKQILSDDDTLKWMASSPLSFISTKLVTTMLPTFLQKSMEGFNKSFENFFPAMLMRINRMSDKDNILMQVFGEIFGAKVYSKSSVDLSKFNRGAIPFDGETKKSIVEVIPGYLRKILAAVSNQEEVAYDMSTGKFEKVRDMKDNFNKTRDRRILNEYGDATDAIRDRTSAFKFKNPKEQEQFNKGVEQFFLNLSRKNSLVNPYRTKSKDGESIDELMDVYDFNNPGMQRLLRQAILSMDKNEVTRIFGRDTLNAKAANNKFYDNAENNPSENNAGTIFNNLGFDQHLEKKNGKMVAKRGSIFNQVDKFNFTALDYLRDIKQTLLQGIRVFPNGSTGGDSDNPQLVAHNASLERMKKAKERIEKEELLQKQKERGTVKELNASQTRRLKSQGVTAVDDGYGIDDLDDSTIRAMMTNRMNITRSNEKENKGVAQWIGKFFKGDGSEKMSLLREKMDDMLQKPAQLLTGVFDKVDSTLHRLVFGKDGKDEESSFFGRMMASTNEYFKRMGTWMRTKVMDPIKESLVGENGIITKIKESEQFKNLKARGKQFAEYMFGKEGQDGKRRDGLLSQTGNNLLDMWDASKYYFTGNPYTDRNGKEYARNEDSVFGQMRQMGTEFKDNVKHYLFGNKASEDVDQQKGSLTAILEGLSTGFGNFRDAIFGPKGMTKSQSKLTFEEMTNTVKARMPKALAWGGVGLGAGALGVGTGLLGSLFLPGGPIGMALVGSALGFASQSDRFNNWLFGEKDARGDRLGGVVSKKVQDFFSRNKATLIGGAAIGALNPVGSMLLPLMTFGMLPAMTMGPMFGAVTGMAAALALRSETMQKFLFGPKDLDGKRAGGIMSKMFKGTKQGKNLLANVGAGVLGGAGLGTLIGQFGMLGFAFGPITGALTGAVAGIALSSDKWKKALFGEWDAEAGLRSGGLLGKFQNFMQMEVIKPFTLEMSQIGLNMKKWFTQSIANPFTDAIAPMKQAFKNMTENLNKFFIDGWASFKEKIGETFENHVGKPFGIFMKENIMDPMKGFFTKLLGGIGKILRPLAEAPIRLLTAFSNGMEGRQKKRGIAKMRESENNALKEQKEAGYRVKLTKTVDADGNVVGDGYFGAMNRKYFNRKYIEEAQYNDKGASYASPEEKKRRKDRDDKQQQEFDDKQAKLDESRKNLDKRRKLGLKYDYDNFTEDGRNISYIYNTTKKASRFRAAFGNDNAANKISSSVADVTGGVSLQEILGLKPEDKIDQSMIGKTQNKLVQQAIKLATKSNLTGDNLRKYLKIGSHSETALAEKAAQDKAAAPMRPVIEAIENSSVKDELKTSIAPKIDVTNSKLDSVVDALKSFGRFMSDESGHVVMDNFLPKKKQKGQTLIGETAKKDPVKTKRESLMERAVLSIEKLVSKLSEPKKPQQTASNEPVETQSEVASGRTLPPVSKKLSNNDLLRRIAIYTRRSAQEMAGQLDGLGSNMYKSRRVLQMLAGVDDKDLTGSSNRDRLGIFGRLKQFLFKPFEAIGDKISEVVYKVGSFINSVKEFAFDIGKKIVQIPVDISKAALNIVTGAFKTGLRILETTAKTIGSGIVATFDVVKTGIVTGIKAFGTGIKVIGDGFMKTLGFMNNMLGIAVDGVQKIGSALFTAGEKIINGVVEGATGLIKGGWEFLKGAGSVVTGLFKSSFGLIKESVLLIGKVGGKVIEKFTDFATATLHGIGDMLVEAGKTFWTVLTSPFKFITKKIGQWLGMSRQEVTVVGGRLDTIGVVEQIASMLPYPTKEERPSVDSIRHEDKQEIMYGQTRPHELSSYISSTGNDSPIINVTVSSLDSHIYEALTDTIAHALHMEPIHVITEGGWDGQGGPANTGSGVNGSSGFGSKGGGFRQSGSGRGNGPVSIRNLYRKARNFKRRGGFSGALGRMSGRFSRRYNQTRKAAIGIKNDGIRGTMNKFYSGLAKGYRAGFDNTNSHSDSFTNGGQYSPNSSPVNAAQALNGAQGAASAMMGPMMGMAGFMPSNIALHSAPVMRAEQAHMTTSRRNAGYEMEQIRVKNEQAMLQNFRLTTMSHMENLDNNVYEILEILRNWKHDRTLPEFEIPFPSLGGGKDGCCCCDDEKLKRIKPDPKIVVDPVINVTIPDIIIPAIPMPAIQIITIPVAIPGVIPSVIPGEIIPGKTIPGTIIPGKVVHVPNKKPVHLPNKKPIHLPETKPNAVPGRRRRERVPGRRTNIPFPEPAKVPEVTPLKPKHIPAPGKPAIEPVPSPGRTPKINPDVLPDRPVIKPHRKPKHIPNPPEKIPTKVPEPIKPAASWGSVWDDFATESRKSAFLPGTKKSIFRKDGPLREMFRNPAPGSVPELFNDVGRGFKSVGQDLTKGKNMIGKGFSTVGKGIGKGAKFVGNLAGKGAMKVIDPITKFANSKFGKVAGKAAAPVFGALGGYSGYNSAGKTFGTDKATKGQKWTNAAAGALMGGTILGLPQFIDDKYSTENLAKEMYSLKNPTEWWDKYGKKNRIPEFSWNGKPGESKAPAWARALGKTRFGKGVKNAVSDGWSDLKSGVGNFFGAKKVGAEGKDEKDFTSKATAKAKSIWDSLSGKTTKAWESMSKGVTSTAGDLSKKTGEKWSSMKTTVGNKTKELLKTTGEKWEGLKKGASGKWTDIKDKVSKKTSELVKDTKDKWDKTKEKATKGWKSISDKVSGRVGEMWKDTKEKWDDTKTKAVKGWKNISGKVTGRIGEMWKDTKEKWDDTKTKAIKGWKNISGKVTGRIGEMWKDTKEKWDNVKTKAVEGWKNISGKVTGRVGEMWKDTKEKWDDVKTKTIAGWKDISGKVTTKVSEIWTNTKDTWDDVKSKTGEKWDEMKKEAPKAAKAIYDGTLGMLGSVKDNVASFGKDIGKKATGIFESLFGSGSGGTTKSSKKSKDHGGGSSKPLVAHAAGALQNLTGWGGGPSKAEMKNGAVYYSQKDKRWANSAFGGANTMGDIGCAPTSAAMVVSTMTGKQVTPDQMAKDAVAGGYVNPQLGTHKSYFNSLGRYGVNMKETGSKSPELMASLMQNKPVVLRGQGKNGSSPYTDNGHFVVATGMNSKGQIMVNDPLSKSKSKAYDASALLKNTTTSFVPTTPKGVEKTADSYGYGAGRGAPITFKSSPASSYGAGPGVRTSGPFKGHYVTSDYGTTSNPTPPKYYHTGIDLQDPGNKHRTRPIKAFTNGKVIKVGSDPNGWGNYIIIQDENGYRHYYAHLSKINVRQGQSIKQKSVIGNQGNSGRVFGANGGYHLHYEIVKPGKFHGAGDTDVNPSSYLSKYKGKKGFIGELLSNFSSAASAVVGGATSLILKAKDKVTSWFDKTFDIGELKQFKVLGQLTKAFGIHQFNAMNKNKMEWLLNEASEAPNADFNGVTGPVDYGMDVRKYSSKKKYKGKYQDILNNAAKKYNIEPQLIAAIIKQESQWNPTAGSDAGAKGLMQLMPLTAKSLGVDDRTDPYQNIMGGTKYITQQLSTHKTLKKALMAYNWGPTKAANANWDLSKAPKETRDYVGIIMRNLTAYRKQVGGGFGGGDVNMLAHGGGNKEENIVHGAGMNDVSLLNQQRVTSSMSQGPNLLSSVRGASELLRKQASSSNDSSGLVDKVVSLLQEIADNTGDTTMGVEQLTKVVAAKETVVVVDSKGSSKPAPKPKPASHNTNPLLGAMADMNPKQSAAQTAYQQAKRLSMGR